MNNPGSRSIEALHTVVDRKPSNAKKALECAMRTHPGTANHVIGEIERIDKLAKDSTLETTANEWRRMLDKLCDELGIERITI